MHFLKTFLFLSLVGSGAALVSCSADSPGGPSSNEIHGTRIYKLDPEAAAIQISIYGVTMGTPDAAKFVYLMRTLKGAGELTQLVESSPGIEGGLVICGTFAAHADQARIYEVLRSVETSTKETNFSAVSTSNCSPTN